MEHTWLIPLAGVTLPTQNSRMHHMKRARLIHDIRELARMVSLGERNRLGLAEATEPRAVTLTLIRGPGQKMLDSDNAIAALKVVRDSLQCKDGAGWIVDDSPRWAKVAYGPQERGLQPGVTVTVTEP